MGRPAPNINKKPQVRKECYRYLGSPLSLSHRRVRRYLESTLGRLAQIAYSVDKLWHLPDNCDWMAPLPLQHRRWFCAMAILLLLVLFWPSSSPSENDNQPPPRQNSLTYAARYSTLTPQHVAADGKPSPLPPGQSFVEQFREKSLNLNDIIVEQSGRGAPYPIHLKTGQYVEIKQDVQGAGNGLNMKTPQYWLMMFQHQYDDNFQHIYY